MEQRISLVTIGVGDLQRSRRFYVDGLGWKPVFENEGVVFFQLNAILIGLFGLDDLAKDSGYERGRMGTGGMALAYNTRSRAEVDGLLAQAEAAGAPRPAPAEEKFWGGYSGYFVDPDGHLWEIAWNPGFKLDEKGNVQFG
jgi:hypothetical protein